MPGPTTTLRLNGGAVNALLRSRSGPVGRSMQFRAQMVAVAARQMAPVGKVNGGTLRAGITARLETVNGLPAGIVRSTAPHSMWVHGGTGIYAGRGYIIPKAGRYMKFSTAYGKYNIRSDGGYYYARRIKGQKPNPFLLKALRFAVK